MPILYASFLLSVAFPYTQFLPLESYTQPYALVLGSMILTLRFRPTLRAMPQKDRWALTGLLIVGVVMFLVGCFPYTDPQELKYLLNYLAPFIQTCAVLACLRAQPDLSYKVLVASVLAWFFVACVQTVYDPAFLSSLVGTWSEAAEDVVTSGRGVLALAPEPTHHGFHLLVLGGALALLNRYRWVPALCIFEALFLARSSSALLALMMACALWALMRPSKVIAPAAVAGVGAFVVFSLIGSFLSDWTWLGDSSRILFLMGSILQSPTDLLLIDYSVNVRIGGALATFMNAFDTFFIPNGLSHQHWLNTGDKLVSQHDWLLDISTSGPPTGFGIVLFQAGALAIPLLAMPILRIVKAHVPGLMAIPVYAGLAVFLGQYYISTPGFSLLYGCALYKLVEYRYYTVRRPVIAASAAMPATA